MDSGELMTGGNVVHYGLVVCDECLTLTSTLAIE